MKRNDMRFEYAPQQDADMLNPAEFALKRLRLSAPSVQITAGAVTGLLTVPAILVLLVTACLLFLETGGHKGMLSMLVLFAVTVLECMIATAGVGTLLKAIGGAGAFSRGVRAGLLGLLAAPVVYLVVRWAVVVVLPDFLPE